MVIINFVAAHCSFYLQHLSVIPQLHAYMGELCSVYVSEYANPKSPPAEVSKEPFVVDGLLHPDLIVVVWTVAAFQG